MSGARIAAWARMVTAWQWLPVVRGGRIVWVVEKNSAGAGQVAGWRLQETFATPREAMDAAGDMNNGGRKGARIRRVTDADQVPAPLTRAAQVARVKRSAAVGVGRATGGKATPNPKRLTTPVPAGAEAEKRDALEKALRKRDGLWVFQGLWRGSERIPARLVSGGFGVHWRLRDGIEKRFDVPVGPNSRVQRELGLRQAEEVARGVVKTRRAGGKTTIWVARAGCPWGTDALLVGGGKVSLSALGRPRGCPPGWVRKDLAAALEEVWLQAWNAKPDRREEVALIAARSILKVGLEGWGVPPAWSADVEEVEAWAAAMTRAAMRIVRTAQTGRRLKAG